MSSSHSQRVRLSLVNYDILSYIDRNYGGSSSKKLELANIESYLKQPFLIANTAENGFDEVNLSSLYNGFDFGDIVVTSSSYSPSYAHEVNGVLFVNVGSLGIEENFTKRHYLTVVSIYEGEGGVSGRTRVDVIEM